jgi:hypothetical protein
VRVDPHGAHDDALLDTEEHPSTHAWLYYLSSHYPELGSAPLPTFRYTFRYTALRTPITVPQKPYTISIGLSARWLKP